MTEQERDVAAKVAEWAMQNYSAVKNMDYEAIVKAYWAEQLSEEAQPTANPSWQLVESILNQHNLEPEELVASIIEWCDIEDVYYSEIDWAAREIYITKDA